MSADILCLYIAFNAGIRYTFILAGSHVFKRRGEVHPKGSGNASGKLITFHRHRMSRSQLCLDAIGKGCRIITGSCFLTILLHMQLL